MNEKIKSEGKKLSSLRYVEVRWLDAAVGDSWVPINGEADVDVAQCISRGWVVKEDEKQVILCSTVGMNKDGLVEDVNGTIAIPFAMVQSVKDFPSKPKKKKVAKKKQKPVAQPTPPDVLTEQVKEALDG